MKLRQLKARERERKTTFRERKKEGERIDNGRDNRRSGSRQAGREDF